jgi:hypothetical protein
MIFYRIQSPDFGDVEHLSVRILSQRAVCRDIGVYSGIPEPRLTFGRPWT